MGYVKDLISCDAFFSLPSTLTPTFARFSSHHTLKLSDPIYRYVFDAPLNMYIAHMCVISYLPLLPLAPFDLSRSFFCPPPAVFIALSLSLCVCV